MGLKDFFKGLGKAVLPVVAQDAKTTKIKPTLSYCIDQVLPLIAEFRVEMGPYAEQSQAYAIFTGLEQFLEEKRYFNGS